MPTNSVIFLKLIRVDLLSDEGVPTFCKDRGAADFTETSVNIYPILHVATFPNTVTVVVRALRTSNNM